MIFDNDKPLAHDTLEQSWYVQNFLHPLLCQCIQECRKNIIASDSSVVVLQVLGELLHGTVKLQGFHLMSLDLTLYLGKWFQQHHLQLSPGMPSTVSIKLNRHPPAFNLLPLLQLLYVKNELECMIALISQTMSIPESADLPILDKPDFSDIDNVGMVIHAAKQLHLSIQQCLLIMNANTLAADGKVLNITPSMTDPPIPPELSISLHIHNDALLLECMWNPISTTTYSDSINPSIPAAPIPTQDKKGGSTTPPLLLTLSLPSWALLQQFYRDLLLINDFASHISHPFL
jgi:hypothetical protein